MDAEMVGWPADVEEYPQQESAHFPKFALFVSH